MKKSFLILLLILLIPSVASAGYRSEGWLYAGSITLPDPGSTQTDYIATITPDMLDADIADYWYNNGADLRFATDSAGDSPLAFYWERKYTTDFKIKLKIPSYATDTKLYYFVGNSTAGYLDDDDTYGKDNVYPSSWKMDFDMELQELPTYFCDGNSTPNYNVVTQPAAMQDEGVVYLTWQGGPGAGESDIFIRTYTIATGVFSAAVKIMDDPVTSNDHQAPTIMVDNDSYLHMFSGSHDCSGIFHYKSDDPADISAWTAQTKIPGSYSTYMHTLRTNDYIWGGWLDSDTAMVFYFGTLTDDFQSATAIIENPGSLGVTNYIGQADYDAINDRVWLPWTVYEGTYPAGAHEHVYVAYQDLDDFHMYSADGTDLGTSVSPAEATSYCKVVDDGTYAVCIPTLILDNEQHPHILYTHTTATTWSACHKSWSGSAWSSEAVIAACGHAQNVPNGYYSDGELHAYFPQNSNSEWGGSLFHYVLSDGSWSKVRTVVDQTAVAFYGDSTGVGVPGVVYNGTDELRMIAYAGDIDDFTNSDLPGFAFDSKDNFVSSELSTSSAYTSILDATTEDNHGSISGAIHNNSGKIGMCMLFDGANDYVTLNSTILTTSTSYSIGGWIYPNGDNANAGDSIQCPFSLWDQYSMRMLMEETTYSGGGGDFAYEHTGTYLWEPFTDTAWQHYVVTYDSSGNLKFYLNGSLTDTETLISQPIVKTAVSTLGMFGGGLYYFKGSLDEVFVSQSALSADYIEQLYDNQNDPENWPTATSGLVYIGCVPMIQPVIVY